MGTDFSPTSGARLNTDDVGVDGGARPAATMEEGDFDPYAQRRADELRRQSMLQNFTAGFSRPDPTKRRFMWIHTPYNNPPWVKVSGFLRPGLSGLGLSVQDYADGRCLGRIRETGRNQGARL
jgi:hypothetical protein